MFFTRGKRPGSSKKNLPEHDTVVTSSRAIVFMLENGGSEGRDFKIICPALRTPQPGGHRLAGDCARTAPASAHSTSPVNPILENRCPLSLYSQFSRPAILRET